MTRLILRLDQNPYLQTINVETLAISGKCIKGKYPNGQDYRGTLDHTIDGITCQKWSSRYPHSHKLLPYPYKDTGKEDPDGLGKGSRKNVRRIFFA